MDFHGPCRRAPLLVEVIEQLFHRRRAAGLSRLGRVAGAQPASAAFEEVSDTSCPSCSPAGRAM